MRLSVRWRLTLWNVLALAVVLAGFSLLVYGLLAHALYEQVDRSLLAELRQLRGDERLASRPRERLRYWADEFLEHERHFCVVYGRDGQVYLRTTELAEDSVPPAPPAAAGDRFDSRALPAVGRQRALQARLPAGGEEYTVLLLAPLADVDHELGELLVALCTAVPVALVLCGGVAYLLARKALAPVERLHRLTAEITAERLDRRLPVERPDDELGRLARTINEMIARLERSFAEVRRFTADASHELRTPLAAIRAEAEVALARPLSAADHQELLGSVLEECERLTRLTDQLLALAREDAGAPAAYRPLDLAALVGGVAETMRPLAEARSLCLEHSAAEGLAVRGDEGRLRQVFYNLLDNALKYTPAGGAVEVRAARQGGEAVVSVRDTGVGIAAEHLPRVFDRFYRADKGRSRAEGGTGLGLSIARSIVLAHGGRIDLVSASGQGTVCTVTLPVAPAAGRNGETSERAAKEENIP
jgi:two-component system, OmpR family, heavy metal sensor histidine kinase CusS